jgi:hypothetical protein
LGGVRAQVLFGHGGLQRGWAATSQYEGGRTPGARRYHHAMT